MNSPCNIVTSKYRLIRPLALPPPGQVWPETRVESVALDAVCPEGWTDVFYWISSSGRGGSFAADPDNDCLIGMKYCYKRNYDYANTIALLVGGSKFPMEFRTGPCGRLWYYDRGLFLMPPDDESDAVLLVGVTGVHPSTQLRIEFLSHYVLK